MGRRLSFQRADRWEVFEITMRAHQGRFLMGASDEAGRRIVGVIARGLHHWGRFIKVHVVTGVSNHLHLLISTENSVARRYFLSFVAGNISKELGRLHDWPQALIGRRSASLVVVDDPAVRNRAIYAVAHGRKEGLLAEGESWPGLPVREALVNGRALTGVWYNRTDLYYAHRKWLAKAEDVRGPEPTEMDFASEVTVPFTPLPYVEAGEAASRADWAAIYAEMEARYPLGKDPVGLEVLRNQDPHFRPRRTSRRPAPKAHFTCAKAYAEWQTAYKEFETAFRQFTRDLAEGVVGKNRWVEFPAGGCPPAELLPAFAKR